MKFDAINLNVEYDLRNSWIYYDDESIFVMNRIDDLLQSTILSDIRNLDFTIYWSVIGRRNHVR